MGSVASFQYFSLTALAAGFVPAGGGAGASAATTAAANNHSPRSRGNSGLRGMTEASFHLGPDGAELQRSCVCGVGLLELSILASPGTPIWVAAPPLVKNARRSAVPSRPAANGGDGAPPRRSPARATPATTAPAR